MEEATAPARRTHSRTVPGGRGFWRVERLWTMSEGLPPFEVAVEDVPEFDMNCWFGDAPPTCREVAQHAGRIHAADLAYPIILAADGALMDGGHRLAKAWLAGLTHVPAVQFARDPEPDWVQPASR